MELNNLRLQKRIGEIMQLVGIREVEDDVLENLKNLEILFESLFQVNTLISQELPEFHAKKTKKYRALYKKERN